MTPLSVQAARALCEAATSGPWILDERIGCVAVYTGEQRNCLSGMAGFSIHFANGKKDDAGAWTLDAQKVADAAFIAAARTGWPEALDEIERLRARHEAILPGAIHLNIAALQERIAELEADVSRLAQDGERLDWLDAKRDAIDAAMKDTARAATEGE